MTADDTGWVHRIEELRQHVRDLRHFRVAWLDDTDPNFRYRFVSRRMAQLDDELATLQRQVARLSGTRPFHDNEGEHQP